MARLDRVLDRFTFGGRLPGAVGLLIVVTAATSLVSAFVSRHGAPLFEILSLRPDDVLHGQIWRLVTWAFVEPDPLSLVFALLMLWWFGRDLAWEWGQRRFFATWGAITLVASVVTCLVALADPAVRTREYLGAFAVSEAMIVAWGLWFPDRRILVFFVIPIRGVWIAWGTIALTVIYAVYAGWEAFVPVLVADAAMLLWLFRRSLRAKVQTFEKARQVSKQKAVQKKRRASAAHLRVIEGGDNDPPPLPPELEQRIGSLLDPKKKKD